MTSLLQPQTNASCKKLEPISVYRTKTLKKPEQQNTFDFDTKTKPIFSKNARKMQISTFEVSDDIIGNRRAQDNDFSNIDLPKDGGHLGGKTILDSRTFLDKLHCFGLDGVDRLEDSLVAPEPTISLKRVKSPVEPPTIHIDPPKNFFEELTPDLLQSRLMPNGPNASIRDNESMMYFFDIKQPSIHKSNVFPRHLSSQVLSPSRVFGDRRPLVTEHEKLAKFDLQEPLVLPGIQLANRRGGGSRLGAAKKSPENYFWAKGDSSPLKDFNVKSTRRGGQTANNEQICLQT